jgi:hypothetical protein
VSVSLVAGERNQLKLRSLENLAFQVQLVAEKQLDLLLWAVGRAVGLCNYEQREKTPDSRGNPSIFEAKFLNIARQSE